MRIRDAACVMLATVGLLVFAGCEGDVWPSGENRLEELSVESVDILVELESMLNAIEDEQMLQATVPKVRDRLDRLDELDRKMARFLSDGVKLSPEKDKELTGRMWDIQKERWKREHAAFDGREQTLTWESMEGSEQITEMLQDFYRQHTERMKEVKKAQRKRSKRVSRRNRSRLAMT